MYIVLSTFTDGNFRFLALQPNPGSVRTLSFSLLVLRFRGGAFWEYSGYIYVFKFQILIYLQPMR